MASSQPSEPGAATAPVTLERVREVAFQHAALVGLGARLPESDEALDGLVGQAVRERDEVAFERLVFAALATGRTINARHLAEGAPLFHDPERLVAAAWHCSGEVAEALVAAGARARMGIERQTVALFVAALWCRERRPGEALPPALVRHARSLARAGSDPMARVVLNALAGLVGDPGLDELLEPPGGDRSALVQSVAHLLVGRVRASIFPVLPETPEERVLSGHPVRRAVPRIGRNEPCPCGSGKKYKRCCHDRDLERLRRSSDVPGVTVDELRAHPERHLTALRLLEMRAHELARLDPAKVPKHLRGTFVDRLVLFREHDAAARFFEAVGFAENLAYGWMGAVRGAAADGEAETVRRLLAVRPDYRPEAHPELGLAVRLLLTEEASGALEAVEAEALEALRSAHPFRLADMAHDLLASPYPALGILVARGVLPVAQDFDADVLLDVLLEARDRLGLEPSDPLERLAGERSGAGRPAPSGSEAVDTLRADLEEKRRESNRLRDEIAALQNTLAEREKAPAETPEPAHETTPADTPEVRELRQKLGTLKDELKDRHRERNQLRRELSETRRRLETALEAEPAPEPGGTRTDTDEDEAWVDAPESGTQPIRIPRFPAKFDATLRDHPPQVARAAVELVGRLAAGETRAFRGARRLRRKREVCRQKVGAAHRLLFRLEADTLEVIDLVDRQDLERAVKAL